FPGRRDIPGNPVSSAHLIIQLTLLSPHAPIRVGQLSRMGQIASKITMGNVIIAAVLRKH
ncbi:MAG TPA: hypothetical protein PLR25_10790, partial [Planctomycetaceae bacterium]|nr:hypothetical protein [Planctomycetaceae bacterium]